jgi:hypothetical protein
MFRKSMHAGERHVFRYVHICRTHNGGGYRRIIAGPPIRLTNRGQIATATIPRFHTVAPTRARLRSRLFNNTAMTPHTVEHPYIQLHGTSRYSRHGDTISLFAERIDNLNSAGGTSGNLALQFWACRSPYTGGALTGWKLADYPLGTLASGHFLASVEAEVPASAPESGNFSITLVVAEWDGEGFNLVHDFHNYPVPDVFIHPRLEGVLGYRCVDEQHLVIDIERIHNPRDPYNLSGSLSLELWALTEPYTGGDFRGHALAGITLGTLNGGASWQDCAYDTEITLPPPGTYTLALMLREWVGNGYVTRDHCNFDLQVTFPIEIKETHSTATPGTEEAIGQAAEPEQFFEQTRDTIEAGEIGNPDQENVCLATQDIECTPVVKKDESLSVWLLLDDWKQFTRQLWGKIRKRLPLQRS